MTTPTKQIALTPGTLEVVKAKAAAGCFMCRWTLEALGPDQELRAWPQSDQEVQYPIEAQKYHITKELGR